MVNIVLLELLNPMDRNSQKGVESVICYTAVCVYCVVRQKLPKGSRKSFTTSVHLLFFSIISLKLPKGSRKDTIHISYGDIVRAVLTWKLPKGSRKLCLSLCYIFQCVSLSNLWNSQKGVERMNMHLAISTFGVAEKWNSQKGVESCSLLSLSKDSHRIIFGKLPKGSRKLR